VKFIGITLVLIGCGYLASCDSGGGGESETHWLTCGPDTACPDGGVCVGGTCMTPAAGTRAGAGGAIATGGGAGASGAIGSGGSGGSGGTQSLDAGGPPPDSSVAERLDGSAGETSVRVADASPGDASRRISPDGGAPTGSGQDAGAAGGVLCAAADASFHGPDSVGGAGYADNGLWGDSQRSVFIAGDGSAFTAWLAVDSTSSYAQAHASRYTPAGGWAPLLAFDQWQKGFGGSSPAVAASDDGEAMLLWRRSSGADGGISYELMAMRYASGWEAPVRIEGPSMELSQVGYALGADAQGDFVAAWVDAVIDGRVRMARYTRGSGWGSIEAPAPNGPDAGNHPGAFGVNVSVGAGGNALVAWSEGSLYSHPYSVAVERFVPGTGWSGRETLSDPAMGQLPASAPTVAVGNDGSAAVTWVQASHPIVRVFSGSWSPPQSLDEVTGTPGINPYYPAIATDSQGTFVVAWGDQDKLYATRITPGGSWSAAVLNVPPGGHDGAVSSRKELNSQIAMNAAGEAIVSWSEWDQEANTYSLDVSTYSPASGWAAPTRLDTNPRDTAPPVIDACGNATLVWARSGTGDVMAARHAHGGSWTSPSRLGTAPSTGYDRVAAGIGSSGEVVASFRSQDGHAVVASVLR